MDQPLPMTRNGFAVLPLGDAAVTVEFGCTIEPGLNEQPSLCEGGANPAMGRRR